MYINIQCIYDIYTYIQCVYINTHTFQCSAESWGSHVPRLPNFLLLQHVPRSVPSNLPFSLISIRSRSLWPATEFRNWRPSSEKSAPFPLWSPSSADLERHHQEVQFPLMPHPYPLLTNQFPLVFLRWEVAGLPVWRMSTQDSFRKMPSVKFKAFITPSSWNKCLVSELSIFLACSSFLVVLRDLVHTTFSTDFTRHSPQISRRNQSLFHFCFLYGTCSHENITSSCGHCEVVCLVVPVCCELHLSFIHPCYSCLPRDEVAMGGHLVHSHILLLIHKVSALPFLRSLALPIRSRLFRNPCQKEIWGMSQSGSAGSWQ